MFFGNAANFSVQMAGPFGNGGGGGKLSAVTLPLESWKGAVSPYSQEVAVEGVSVNSRVKLLPTVEQIRELNGIVTQFTAVNDGGTITVYAIGDKPEKDYSFLAELAEVTA